MNGTTGRGHRSQRMPARFGLGLLALLAAVMPARAAEPSAGRIERIELQADGPSTKVLIMLSRSIAFDVRVLEGDAKSARRLVLDFPDATLAPAVTKPIAVANDRLRQIRPGQFDARTARVVLDLTSATTHAIETFETPPHVTIALSGAATGGTPPAVGTAPPQTPPAATAPPAVAPVAVAPAAAAAAAGAGALSTTETAAVAPPSSGTLERSKTPVRPIPIRARGRRPYSLNYWR